MLSAKGIVTRIQKMIHCQAAIIAGTSHGEQAMPGRQKHGDG
jgi:hypothetical protein